MQKIVRNYYLMMSPFVIGYIIYSFKINSIRPLIMFVMFAVAGVIGETLVDIWWRMFYREPLWVYKVETVYHGYTSWLNFIPWALGGFLYLRIINQVGPSEIPLSSGIIFVGLILLQTILFYIFRPSARFKFQKINLTSLLVFFFPIFLFIVFLARQYGSEIYILALLFASVATLAEYLFGKVSEIFISKKLWAYTYLSVDRGHFTPLSVPLFALGGFYFWIISIFIS